MSLLDNFPHTCTAKRRTRTKGTLAGSKDSFVTTVFSARACWRQLANDAEIREFEKRGISVTDKIYFTTDPGLDERHIIEIDGEILEVRSEAGPDASAGLGVVYRVMAERTTTGSTP